MLCGPNISLDLGKEDGLCVFGGGGDQFANVAEHSDNGIVFPSEHLLSSFGTKADRLCQRRGVHIQSQVRTVQFHTDWAACMDRDQSMTHWAAYR